MRSFYVLTLAYLFAFTSVIAQPTPDPEKDTVEIYSLGQVTITANKSQAVTTTTVQQLPLAKIDRTDAATAEGVAYLLPAARIQTNSRGESLLYLRGTGERQVAIFFDGALLNIPWDNRVDLSLVPLNAVGGITVTKGVPSVLYGTNVIGGAVNIVSQELREPGYITEATAQAGEHGFISGSLTHIGNLGTFNYIGSFSHTTRDGIALPKLQNLQSNIELPFTFHQTDSDLRTNTDSRTSNLFFRGEYRPSPSGALGLSLNYITGQKGIAPEGHQQDARFWRYPEWKNLNLALNTDLDLGEDNEWKIRSAFWWTGFQQSIDQFSDNTYQIRTDREEDADGTLGTRLVLRREFDAGTSSISIAFNGLQSNHDQVDLRFDSTGALRPFKDAAGNDAPYPTLEYQHRMISPGIELETRVADGLVATAGASYDVMSTPKTGDKNARDGFSDYSLMGGLAYQIDQGMTVRLSAGRKTRFPTMRELYGEALRRFLLNPNLEPEVAALVELGVEGRGDGGNYSVVGFGNATTSTIDQRSIDTLGGIKRQRINLPGSRTYGIELAGELRLLRPFRIEGHFTWLHTRGRATATDGSDSSFYISEKPSYLGTIAAVYDFPFGLQPSAELLVSGEAYTLDDNNEFVSLGNSATINLRLGYRLPLRLTDNFSAQIFARVNNLMDAVTLPQLGLPGPGREIQGGVKCTF